MFVGIDGKVHDTNIENLQSFLTEKQDDWKKQTLEENVPDHLYVSLRTCIFYYAVNTYR